jgi:D-serine deaminase-like pyridoxal phosphate-dependent protein
MLQSVTRPTVIIDVEKTKRNIDRMVKKANDLSLNLRPHLKTAQSHHIGRYFRELGVRSITVSSLSMASYFAKDGWNDITVAFPVNLLEMDTINELSGRIHLNLLVVNHESLKLLEKGLKNQVGIFVKIDVGTQRTGISPGNKPEIEACLRMIEINPLLSFKGFLCHAGHSYRARSKAEILNVHEETLGILAEVRKAYIGLFPNMIISTGDTPTCSVAESWPDIQELRPGNFVFYDIMQVQIGSCTLEDIAVALACPVVARHPDRMEIIVYGGGVHLSKERLIWEGKEIYGLPVLFHEKGWSVPSGNSFVKSLSQEHGIIRCELELFEKAVIGSLIGILPVHSCMMVDIADHYLTSEGEIWAKF